ncbi:uncharacterized protein J4E87_009876 [Alternaria ethzedia]|uniref:uncharacterized protein n=1 Tax=Alternaria ethzedia TaxID=181014 RepID=UPI0020C27F39|nr:uncharacterized protein J4E87_009876 [Alternaria ethzedia]KAI4613409.1 hypothetical protein J4E87_009876 [Alternaria ethzedia]
MAPRKRKAPSPATAQSAKKSRDERVRRRGVIRDLGSLDRLTELNSINSPLLRLPAELRSIIFTYVFSGEEYLFSGRRGYLVPDAGSFTLLDMSLLLVSRQAYAETALLPYKLGTIRFLFDQYYQMDQRKQSVEFFLSKRSVEQIKAIVSLEACEEEEVGEPFSVTDTGIWWAEKLGVRQLRQKVPGKT